MLLSSVDYRDVGLTPLHCSIKAPAGRYPELATLMLASGLDQELTLQACFYVQSQFWGWV